SSERVTRSSTKLWEPVGGVCVCVCVRVWVCVCVFYLSPAPDGLVSVVYVLGCGVLFSPSPRWTGVSSVYVRESVVRQGEREKERAREREAYKALSTPPCPPSHTPHHSSRPIPVQT